MRLCTHVWVHVSCMLVAWLKNHVLPTCPDLEHSHSVISTISTSSQSARLEDIMVMYSAIPFIFPAVGKKPDAKVETIDFSHRLEFSTDFSLFGCMNWVRLFTFLE